MGRTSPAEIQSRNSVTLISLIAWQQLRTKSNLRTSDFVTLLNKPPIFVLQYSLLVSKGLRVLAIFLEPSSCWAISQWIADFVKWHITISVYSLVEHSVHKGNLKVKLWVNLKHVISVNRHIHPSSTLVRGCLGLSNPKSETIEAFLPFTRSCCAFLASITHNTMAHWHNRSIRCVLPQFMTEAINFESNLKKIFIQSSMNIQFLRYLPSLGFSLKKKIFLSSKFDLFML